MHLIDQQLNLSIRGRFDDAWKICEKLESMYPNLPGDGNLRHKFNRGWFLLQQGKYQEGFQSLEAGRFLNVYGSGKINTVKPIWNQENLKGKTVIINLEAGFGDQIIYARFATEIYLRGGSCILCCHPSLHGILSRIPGVEKCITINDVSTTAHDYWIPGFSCSWLFGHDYSTLPNEPYIIPNDMSIPVWKEMLKVPNEKPKIGIRWGGNPKFEHQQFRIFPPEKLIDLSEKFTNLQFYSLQRDNDLRELPAGVVDLQYLLISWEDTAACIANLDLVITSCTSIAHLAAAMGKPTWVVVPILPYHIWAYGDNHSPWYQKTTRVFRQREFGKWDQPFNELECALGEHFK